MSNGGAKSTSGNEWNVYWQKRRGKKWLRLDREIRG